MIWWKKLKGWQKAGIAAGGAHLILYIALYVLTVGSMGIIILYYLEAPWLLIVSWALNTGTWSASQSEILIIGLTGTIAYTIIVGAFFFGISAMGMDKEKSE